MDELSANDSGLLDADNVPNANQSLTCFSCEEPMTGLYCYACGNKNDNYRRSVWSLGSELFQNLTAFEGRIWASLSSLVFKPGQMAREYADGARQRWTSPIRLFLATSLVLFGYIALSGTQIIVLGDIESGDARSKQGINFEVDEEKYNQRLLFFVRESKLKTPPSDRVALISDGFNLNIGQNRTPESLRAAIDDLTLQIEQTDSEITMEALAATRKGLMQTLAKAEAQTATETTDAPQTEPPVGDETTPDDSGRTLSFPGTNGEIITLDGQGMSDLYARILRNPAVVNNQLNTKLKWAMFFMMPFAMFMGAIFIRGRETAMLYDHLVHAAYVHAFSFLLLFIFILLSQYTAISYLIVWYTVILLVYLPCSVKRAFRRGWFKSLLTAYGVGWVYTWTMLFIATAILATALQSVALDISDHSPTRPIPQTVVPGA
ncbi:DUF3667 domain-containing protein [Algimonas arctica]|nr:DUF3667 domain-containing protein [Algimonas arctica]